MIKAGSVTKGVYLNWRGEPTLVLDKEFHNPGKGSAVVRLKLYGLTSGSVVKEVLKTDESVEEISVERRPAQFMYLAGDQFVFVHPHTFEQYEVEGKIVGDKKGFIKEGSEYQLVVYQGEVIGVVLPMKMALKIIETEDAVKGDTVTGATKSAKLETGITVKVPLFIKNGEEIYVNTETKEYVSRRT